jgi:hypothetical protein
MINNWQHLCQQLDVEVAMNDCTDVDNEASIVQELTEEEMCQKSWWKETGHMATL